MTRKATAFTVPDPPDHDSALSAADRAKWVAAVNGRAGRTVVRSTTDGAGVVMALSGAPAAPGSVLLLVDAVGSTQSTMAHLIDELEVRR
jgi:hypothetical protein